MDNGQWTMNVEIRISILGLGLCSSLLPFSYMVCSAASYSPKIRKFLVNGKIASRDCR